MKSVYIDHQMNYEPCANATRTVENENPHNLTIVYVDHQLDVPTDLQASVQTRLCHFFRLPPELRLMIWEQLLSEVQFVTARMKKPKHIDGNRCECECARDRSSIATEDGIKQPVISQLCRESRAFLQERADLVLGREDEPGLWWIPDRDILKFDQFWHSLDVCPMLVHLKGLHHIQHIYLDEAQGHAITFRAGYDRAAESWKSPKAVSFGFLNMEDRETEYRAQHFVADFFPKLRTITVQFDQLKEIPQKDCYNDYDFSEQNQCLSPNLVRFHVGTTDLKRAAQNVSIFHEL